MDPLVWGDMLPLMVLLDTDVVRMLKMALPPVPELVLLPLMVLLSTVSVPSPLAIANGDGTLTVDKSTISGNSTSSGTGGSAIFNILTTSVSNSTISGNTGPGHS